MKELVWYELDTLAFGEARIIETDGLIVRRAWYYATALDAIYQYLLWPKRRRYLLKQEPDGWYRAIDIRLPERRFDEQR